MKPIDFQGIINLNQSFLDELHVYFKDKEAQLAHCIVNAIHPLPRKSLPLSFLHNTSGETTLRDATRSFAKNVALVAASVKSLVPSNDWELATRQSEHGLVGVC